MKAIEINGEIKTFNRLPRTWEDSNGLHLSFDKVSNPEAYGFYDVVIPTYDSVSHYLSNLHFVESDNVFTYDVLETNFVKTLQEFKESKKNDVKKLARELLYDTDWYVTRFLERQVSIPLEVQESRQSIITKSGEAEDAIDALQTIPDVIKYKIALVDTEELI